MHCLQAVDGHCRVVWDRRSRHLNCTERQIRRQTRLRYSRLHPRATLSTSALDLVLLFFSRLYRGRQPSISVLPTRTLGRSISAVLYDAVRGRVENFTRAPEKLVAGQERQKTRGVNDSLLNIEHVGSRNFGI
ncbi:hypothetical protein ALC56_10040 [Trachymyrmex septentrionalis]|uniref:Uncharacterized protein n=1 Tax=Trachymyrmex septentrionalis TaxID=34720 RepID=A0A195F4U5_9HYME|nr:hypothetical protein ALC56_10040 [Trachymyrmex septentrionalis]